MGNLKIETAISLFKQRAQELREDGDCDMRYIINMADILLAQVTSGTSAQEIIEYWVEED